MSKTSGIDPLQVYLNGVPRTPLLTADEEVELAKRIEQGDQEARKRLIEANLRLVIFFAKRYARILRRRRVNVSFLDLIQEGNVGLLIAVERFDWRRGNRFSSCAVWWIKKFIRIAIRDQKVFLSLHQPSGLRGDSSRLIDCIADATASEPTDDEPTEVVLIEEMRKLVSSFDAQTQRVISLLFGMGSDSPHSVRATAEELGLSYGDVRGIERRALKQMKWTKLVQSLRRHYDVE